MVKFLKDIIRSNVDLYDDNWCKMQDVKWRSKTIMVDLNYPRE